MLPPEVLVLAEVAVRCSDSWFAAVLDEDDSTEPADDGADCEPDTATVVEPVDAWLLDWLPAALVEGSAE